MSDNRLGKGLQALIRSKEDQIKDNLENYDPNLVFKIGLDKIIKNKNQPRKTFDLQSIEQLKESINRKGLINSHNC